MKKLIPIIMILSLLLCACGTQEKMSEKTGKSLKKTETTQTTDTATDDATTGTTDDTTQATFGQEKPQPTEDSEPDPIPSPIPNPNNVFRDDNNIVFEEKQLTIRPKYVYWEGDKLVAECFVINGHYETVSNICVNQLSFANAEQGTLADGAFGLMNGASIAPRSYIVWTFGFSEDAVAYAGGDLSTLLCRYDTTYSH